MQKILSEMFVVIWQASIRDPLSLQVPDAASNLQAGCHAGALPTLCV